MKLVIPPLLLLATLSTTAAATMPDHQLRVTFLDVGQGDAILVTNGSLQVLIDGGPSPQAIGMELGRAMPFWDRTIELVVLTHPHSDHLAGLLDIVPRYRVEQVLYPDMVYDSYLYEQWLNLIRETDIEVTPARAGQQIGLGQGVTINILNPRTPLLTATASDTDNNGVVLHLTSGRIGFLLAADIFREAESELIR